MEKKWKRGKGARTSRCAAPSLNTRLIDEPNKLRGRMPSLPSPPPWRALLPHQEDGEDDGLPLLRAKVAGLRRLLRVRGCGAEGGRTLLNAAAPTAPTL
jgi:hypothetical protein